MYFWSKLEGVEKHGCFTPNLWKASSNKMPGIRSNIYTLWGNNIPWTVWNCLNCIDRTQKTLYVFTGVKWHKMEPLYLRIYWGRYCTSVCNCIHSIAVKSLSFTFFNQESPSYSQKIFKDEKLSCDFVDEWFSMSISAEFWKGFPLP